jgi:hypothetical protein
VKIDPMTFATGGRIPDVVEDKLVPGSELGHQPGAQDVTTGEV